MDSSYKCHWTTKHPVHTESVLALFPLFYYCFCSSLYMLGWSSNWFLKNARFSKLTNASIYVQHS